MANHCIVMKWERGEEKGGRVGEIERDREREKGRKDEQRWTGQ